MPKNIYEEIVNINGEPDIHNSDDESFYLEVNEWYGKNGIIILNKLNNDTIEIIFELNWTLKTIFIRGDSNYYEK